MVWGIEVQDAKPETEHTIRKELDKMGVKIGKVQFMLMMWIRFSVSYRIELKCIDMGWGGTKRDDLSFSGC